jgi:NADH:ubiquinone oxidoreductase subunit E
MEKIKIAVCTGTSCFVMGGSELLLLEDHLGDDLKAAVEIERSPCFDLCGNGGRGKAPFAVINGEIMPQATVRKVLDRIASLAPAGGRG